MKLFHFLAGTVVAAGLWGGPAQAVVLCDCCARDMANKAETARYCTEACKRQQRGEFCAPLVLPDIKVRYGNNPLLGIDLKYLSLKGLTPMQRERVRRWAERARWQGERVFQRARKKALMGKIGKQEFARAEKRRDAIVVNYQHIMRAYREAARAR